MSDQRFNTIGPWIGGIAVLATFLVVGPTLRERRLFESVDSRTSLDASIGSRVDLPSMDIFGKRIDPDETTLVIYAGTCTGCSINAVSPSKLGNTPFKQIVFLYYASPEQIKETISNSSTDVRLISDAKGLIVNQLGAVSAPRYYVVSEHRLKEVWKNTKVAPAKWLGESE